ncbi:MAG: COR domain-containing protein, partial [Chitinophagales bacterium]
ELNISHNQISQIQNLDNLPSLQELNISHNQISQIQNLDNLLSLEILDISSNKISQIQNSDNLLSLEILDISSNKISQIQNLDNLPSLQELNISRNQISQIQNLDNLPSLEILDISYNKISQIQNLDNLPSLEKLYFSYNKISQIQNLDNLPSLETLYIKDNQISKLENLDKLSNLKELNINSNQIKDLTPLLPFIKKGISMSLSYNPWQKPPKNIVLQGTQTILNYFKDIENSKATSEKYIKLQIVGNGCVGKTTLVHRLLDKKYIDIPLKERTHGVIIRNWKLEDPTVIANVWDFGGQEIYHATHRLFLSPRTLYLLVYTPQKEYMPDETYFQPSYWLDYIADLGKGSRVILVQSKIDMSSDNLLSDDLEKLKRYYETHHGLQFGQNLKVSAKTNKGIRALRSEIAEQLEELQKQYKEILPENWLEVRIQIEELKADKSKHFLTYADYLAICKHRKVVSHDTLIAYLHDTGSLYYQKNLFDNKILLQQQWAIDGVYEILRDKHFLNNKRSIQFYELERIWKKHNLAEKRVFIGFMLSCEIAFELTDRQTEEEEKEYVVPQLLSAVAPPFAEFRHEKEVIYYKLTYLFLHQSIIERFIVRTAQTLKAGEAHYWKNGIAWRDSKSNTDIYVESVLASENVSSYERYLKVCLYGSRKAQFLYDIRKRFDGIRKINADAKEEISVDGKDWVTLHSFLENSGGNGVHYENNKSYKRNDFQLFGSFLQHFSRLEQPLRKREQKAMKVFIVYDAKDTEHFERLEKHLKILEREKKIEIWAKNKIIASDKVDEVTQENMQEADIVLLLISIDFLTNKELWEKEIKAALQREEEGKTRVIPIIVRQCEWERKEIFSFAENEPLPKNRLHLSRWPDADEFWSEISSGVHRLVKQPRQPFR